MVDILDHMQVFDKKIATQWCVPEKRLDLCDRVRVDLPALRMGRSLASPAAWMMEVVRRLLTHGRPAARS